MAARKWLVIGLALGAAWLAILVRGNFRGLPPCPLHSTTGLYCPGCGVTRASRALMHGDLGTALQMNAVAILLMPLMAFVMIREIAAWGWQRPEWRPGTGGAGESDSVSQLSFTAFCVTSPDLNSCVLEVVKRGLCLRIPQQMLVPNP